MARKMSLIVTPSELARPVHHGARVDLDRGRVTFLEARQLPAIGRLRLGRQRVHRAQQLHACLAVDGGVVRLHHDRERSGRQPRDAVQTLDHVRFPQRATAIEWSRVQPRHLNHELPPIARLRQRDVAYVELEIEGRIFEPVGSVDALWNLRQAAPADLAAVEPALEVAQDVLETYRATRRGRRIVDAEHADVVVDGAASGVEPVAVEALQLLHPCSSSARRMLVETAGHCALTFTRRRDWTLRRFGGRKPH